MGNDNGGKKTKNERGAATIAPSLERARACAADFGSVPVYVTLPEQTREASELFCVLKRLSRHCFLFESREDPERWGRYTYLGFDPTLELSCTDGKLRVRNGATIEIETREPRRFIEQVLADHRGPQLEELPPFTGGLVGYFSYDYLRYSEPVLDQGIYDRKAASQKTANPEAPRQEAPGQEAPGQGAASEEGFKDVDLMLFDKLIAYDHLEHRIFLIANVGTESLDENYHRAAHELSALAELVATGEAVRAEPLRLKGPLKPLFDEARYCDMVERAKRYIREGDIFQVVLSNRLSAPATGSLFDTYCALRENNPSPYMFYFASDDIELAGSSPETLAKLLDNTVYTFPLAGTRPRGATFKADAELERELLADEKELAEHNMLVDLGRNDVGRVSAFGTVKVERYLDILRFSHVMHIGSTVTGQLAADKTGLDVIDAILPAGTLSGAPKIRACQIINELEGGRRGVYGGAVGYLSFAGNLDTCIAIRLAWLKDGEVFVRSGAGIVADSVAANEYQECRNKMQAVLDALEKSATSAVEAAPTVEATPAPEAEAASAPKAEASAVGAEASAPETKPTLSEGEVTSP
ncbi:MAG: anthranilate synthase component I family protein [Coriobacteriales bacterium]|jgi:anthranilate synthase component 1|nr:anthranilate synthase component I family protein [Coriobacteriales bacterium]